jgi:hypothetical protein
MESQPLIEMDRLQSSRHPSNEDIEASAILSSIISANNATDRPVSPLFEHDSEGKADSLPGNASVEDLAREPRRTLSQELYCWIWELAATLLFLVTLAAIVGTLYSHQNKPLPQWPIHISINALLSIYSVLFKAALSFVVAAAIVQTQWSWFALERPLYDVHRYHGSGGILNAINWLKVHTWHQPLAAFGAIIVLAALAVDPFIQQLLQYTDCSVVFDQGIASIPRTLFFNPVLYHQGSGTGLAADASPSRAEEQPIIAGAFSSPGNINFTCSTGNCTWVGEYSTVGYCSSCTDLSSSVRYSSRNVSCGLDSTALCVNDIASLPSGLILGTLENGEPNLLIMAPTGNDPSAINFEIIVGATQDVNHGQDPATGNLIPGCQNSIMNKMWTCTGSGAASCQLLPCVRTYSANITNWNLTEVLVSTNNLTTGWGRSAGLVQTGSGNAAHLMGLVDKSCIDDDEKQSLAALNVPLDPSVRWIPYMPSFDATPDIESNVNITDTFPPDSPFPESLLVHQCLYMMSYDFAYNLGKYFLVDFFNGTVSGELNEEGLLGPVDGPQLGQQFFNFGNNNFSSISQIFDQIAVSMTNHIRVNGQQNFINPANGSVKHYATCVHVNWVWISLPAALAGLSILLLGLVMVSTAREQTPLWKSSPLAFFYHSPHGKEWFRDAGPLPKGVSINSTAAMEQMAKNTNIKLDRSEASIRLIRVGQSSDVE